MTTKEAEDEPSANRALLPTVTVYVHQMYTHHLYKIYTQYSNFLERNSLYIMASERRVRGPPACRWQARSACRPRGRAYRCCSSLLGCRRCRSCRRRCCCCLLRRRRRRRHLLLLLLRCCCAGTRPGLLLCSWLSSPCTRHLRLTSSPGDSVERAKAWLYDLEFGSSQTENIWFFKNWYNDLSTWVFLIHDLCD